MNKAGNDSARVSGQDSKKPPAPWTSQIAGFGGFRPFASLEKNNTSVLLFIQNISPFLIGSNRSANSLQPISVGQIWKMRAIYHRFNGIFDWKRGWSIILSACKRGCWLGKRTLINLVSRRGPPGCFFMVELKKTLYGYPKTKWLNFWLKLNWRNESTGQKRVRGFHQGFQTPRNGWKHDAEGGVLLMFRGVWNPWWKTKHEFLSWLLKLVWEFSGIISEE